MENIDINPDILDRFKNAGINSLQTIVAASSSDLQRKAKLSQAQTDNVKDMAMKIAYPMVPRLAEHVLSETEKKIPTGCPSIDKLLSGGLLCQGITELTGESACGKTQICMQIALNSQLVKRKDKFCNSLYICTEDVFPSQRLLQMESHIKSQTSVLAGHRFGDGVYVEHCSERNQVLGLLENRVPLLLKQGQTNLIIIDSLTALFRGQEVEQSTVSRSKDIASIGLTLHRLADEYKLCVLCVNQVKANMTPYSLERSIPALGLTWANLVTTRLMVKRRSLESPIRTLEVKFAPHLDKDFCEYSITTEGVVDVIS